MKTFFVVVGCVLGVLFVLFVGMFGLMKYFTWSNNLPKGSYSAVLEGGDPDKKALVVFQPSSGKACQNIANELAKGLNEAGYEVTVGYPGKHLPEDVGGYSILVFGSPVFFGQPSTAVTDYMKSIGDVSDKKVVLYSVGRIDDKAELGIMEKSLVGAQAERKIKFSVEKKDNENSAYMLGLELGKE